MTSIDVTLTLASPLYVAYPGNYDDTKKISYTTKLPVMIDGQLQYIPYYPANGFRGALRRKAMGLSMPKYFVHFLPVNFVHRLAINCPVFSGFIGLIQWQIPPRQGWFLGVNSGQHPTGLPGVFPLTDSFHP